MSVDKKKLDLLEKWKLMSNLKGIHVFDDEDADYTIYEYIDQLSEFDRLKETNDPQFLCALSFMQMGLTVHDYDDIQEHLAEERAAEDRRQLQAAIDDNELIKELVNKYRYREVEAKSEYQLAFAMDVPTDNAGTIAVKGRVVSPTWGTRRVWADYKVGKQVTHKAVEYSRFNMPKCDPRFPGFFADRGHWNKFNDDYDIFIYALDIIKEIERQYSNPAPKRKRKK